MIYEAREMSFHSFEANIIAEQLNKTRKYVLLVEQEVLIA